MGLTASRAGNGSLPSGREIGRFGWHERWAA
jgi:hypothetical protein